ncbi:MAG: serine/threonine protein kinase [Proteobacteria bacterium]|nr:serine/threonine protein kinase [Pseudomonadota bacterium]
MAEAPMEAAAGEEIPAPDAALDPEAETPSEAEPPAPAVQPAAGPVVFRDHYLIDTHTPLPHLDTPSAKAYAVEDRRDLGRKLFGLVCTPGLPTRIHVMNALKGEELDGLMPLVEWDTLDWPLLGQHSMIIIYALPKGGNVLSAIKSGAFKVNEYEFPRQIMGPLVQGLKSASSLDFPHRAIRPSNVFFMDEEMQVVVLGDCVTAPPGFDQPSLFETIERSMAQPGGRGTGGLADDVYALGATLTVLMLGYNPVANISKDDLIRDKIEQGSYAAICSNARLPIPLLEPLRGMLNDTIEERWLIPELTGWLDGQKQPSIQQVPVIKSDFPYTFNNTNHYNPRTLSLDLSRHRDKAMEAIKDDAFNGWLRKGLQDPNRADGVKATIDTAALHQGEPQGTDEFIISKVCTVLDPQAPIRYKGLSFMPDGYGPFLAVELLRRGDVQVPTEIVVYEIPNIWYSMQQTVFEGASVQQQEYARLKGYLSIQDPGYGYERCLYEINPSMPCQSELIAEDYVFEIEDLLPALDAAAKRVDTHKKPMDRHIAAFIAARFEEDTHPHLKALAADNDETATIGMLSLLAFLQWKLRLKELFGLSSWVGGLSGPAINTYHSRTTRRAIEKEIPRLVRKGSLPELFDLIDNADNRKTDMDGFEAAIIEYGAAEMEIRDLEGSGTERQTKAERVGKQTAAVISVVFAMIVVCILLIAEFW